MKIKGIIAGFLILTTFFSCETEKVMTFEPLTCVYFANATDTSRFSFGTAVDLNAESAIFTIPVNIIGSATNRDREFFVETLEGAKDAQTRYEIIQPSLLKANRDTAYIEIRVWKTPNLEIDRDAITIVLKGSNDLIADMENNSSRCVTFYGKIDRPSWWTVANETTHYGRFHEIKMKILNIVLGSMDNPRSDTVAWPYYKTILNFYCEENDIRYPDTNEPVRFMTGY